MTLRWTFAALLCAVPLQTIAEGWTTEDLGDVAAEAECVTRAADMFEVFGERHGFHSVATGGWTVAGYDLIEDDYDGLVTCAYGPQDGFRATLVIYSAGAADDDRRREIASTLKGIWDE